MTNGLVTPEGMAFVVPNRVEKRGYERKRRRLTLAFDGHETLDGLEITCRSVSLGSVMDLQARFADFQRAEAGSDAEREALNTMLEEFGGMVDSWNYRDLGADGVMVDVPFTWQMLRDEFDFVESMAIVNAHLAAVQGVAGPLRQTSADGQPSAEAQIPMDVPSESRAS